MICAAGLHGSYKMIVDGRKIDPLVTRVWVVGCEPFLVLLTARSLVRVLVDGHFEGQYLKTGTGAKCRSKRRVDTAAHTDHKSSYTCVLCIALQPSRNMIRCFL